MLRIEPVPTLRLAAPVRVRVSPSRVEVPELGETLTGPWTDQALSAGVMWRVPPAKLRVPLRSLSPAAERLLMVRMEPKPRVVTLVLAPLPSRLKLTWLIVRSAELVRVMEEVAVGMVKLAAAATVAFWEKTRVPLLTREPEFMVKGASKRSVPS